MVKEAQQGCIHSSFNKLFEIFITLIGIGGGLATSDGVYAHASCRKVNEKQNKNKGAVIWRKSELDLIACSS